MLLSCFRNLVKGTKIVQSGNWRNEEDKIRGNELYKKKIGIIGFGRIGENIFRYAKSFGMKIKAYDPFKLNKLKKLKISSNLNDLLKNSDVVTVSVHLNKKTKNMCNKFFFNKMKKNSIFINTSRGEIVDEISLIKALKSKKIKSAAVDVIQGEQKKDITKNRLFKYSKQNENLIITPHMAGLTYESEKMAADITLSKLNDYFKKNNNFKKIKS